MMTERGFLRRYFESFDAIEGWFMQDAALLFLACNQIVAEHGISGDVLEIGVHHGLSAILSASLGGQGRRFVAVDLFDELQDMNTSGSGAGSRAAFMANMSRFHPDLSFMEVIVGSSQLLSSAALGSEFSFCHIDGGHSASETYHDLELCHTILMPGGLAVVDDYFNANWPGVGEGAFRHHLEHPASFTPVATGYNKVVLQKMPSPFDARAALQDRFPDVPKSAIQFWETPAYLFTTDLKRLFDLDASTPAELAPRFRGAPGLRIESDVKQLTAKVGQTVQVPVRMINVSEEPIRWDTGMVGLSHHVVNCDGESIRWDNPRQYFQYPLPAGKSLSTELPVVAPDEPGTYRVELDVVWEGVAWLSHRGLTPYCLDLTVANSAEATH